MARNIEGIRRAEVVGTDEFSETGKIKIRVMGLMPEDAWEEALVVTPFGGLPNMGMHMLPPVGAQGYVFFERGRDTIPVWLGALMMHKKSLSRFQSEDQDIMAEGWAHPVEGEDPTDFVMKTQYPKSDEAGGEELEGENIKIENIWKMNENEISFAKVRQDADEYSYEKEPYELEEKAYNLIKLTDKEIKINFKFSDNSKTNSISVDNSSAKLSFDTDDGSMTVEAKEDTIELTAGSSKITVNKDGDIEAVTDGIIKLNGEDNSGVLYEPLRDFINTVFNSHTHGTPAGPSSPPTTPYNQSKSMQSKSVKLT